MKILLIRFSSLGDVVLATAAVEALRADRPDAEVHVLTKPAFRGVFQENPGVARVVEWDPAQGLAALARHLRSERYDGVVDLHGNLRTRLLRFLVPSPRWTRYAKGSLRRRVAVALGRPGLLGKVHVVDRYLEAMAPLGVPPIRRLPRLYPGVAERTRARSLLSEAGRRPEELVVALAPSARWPTKAWPREHWQGLLRELSGPAPRFFPVLVGGAGDRELCAAILGAERGADLAGKTSVLETAAVLEEARVLVSNDSAPLHLANAVGTPAVALFGPTVRGFGFYPLGPRDVVLEQALPCRPCSLHGGERCPEGHHRCLAEIPVGSVRDAAVRALEESGGPGPGERGSRGTC
ncbi:MAG: glycosyltransferase family 9 protein [Thermodesulfobacteriota bacterium]